MYIDIDVIFYAIMTGCVIVFIIGLVYGFDGQEKKMSKIEHNLSIAVRTLVTTFVFICFVYIGMLVAL